MLRADKLKRRPKLSPRGKSLCAFVFVVCSFGLLVLVGEASFKSRPWLALIPAAFVLIGFYGAIKIRCPSCGMSLHAKSPFRGGGAILLWAVQESCPHCEHKLGWRRETPGDSQPETSRGLTLRVSRRSVTCLVLLLCFLSVLTWLALYARKELFLAWIVVWLAVLIGDIMTRTKAVARCPKCRIGIAPAPTYRQACRLCGTIVNP